MKLEFNSENGNRFGESVLLKLALIGFLTLILLIPNFWIQDLIAERQQRQLEIDDQISNDWSGRQLVAGPVLAIPYTTTIIEIENDKNKTKTTKEVISIVHILPDKLEINGEVKPEKLHRGIFETVVYQSQIDVKGSFSEIELTKSGIDPSRILWSKAKVIIGLSDLKGLKNNPEIKILDSLYQVEPDFSTDDLFDNNLSISVDLSKAKSAKTDFSFMLNIKGSKGIDFMHLGKKTQVKLSGNWPDPSFTGRYLPDNRSFKEGKFYAEWNLSYFNRSFPQQWQGDRKITALASDMIENPNVKQTEDDRFGVNFILPVDQYQKTMRTAKYSILVIMLTFIALFFMEFLQKRKIHFLQYVLISAAMIVFYTLLLSIGERIGFNVSYLISSISTIALIGIFVRALMKSTKPALLFSIILTVFYGFIFVIIQLQDLALISGSIALFIIVAVLMYLSAKIEWSTKS
jgi:inner membrane protein